VLDPRLSSGERIVWEAVPDPERSSLPSSAIATLALEAAKGSSAIVVLPDSRAIAALASRFRDLGLLRWTSRSGGDFAIVHTEDGPSIRYENYLAALHGAAPIVLGTRSTVFQPVPSLGLLLLWAEGHSAYQDLHAPYPHARTVAAIRTETERSRLILGGWAPSVEAAALVEHGWASYVSAPREAIRESVPVVEVLTEDRRSREGPQGWHWMPGTAWRALTAGLSKGPVFILVPRAGYVTALACARCSQWAQCVTCGGQLSMGKRGTPPTCGECGAQSPHWHCPGCHSDRMSESRQGVERIAEQVQRMAPGIRVFISSAATGILEDGALLNGIVVATPGSLPAVDGGYAVGVIIGADSGLGRAGTEVDAAGLWFGAAALVRSRKAGGRVVVVGDIEPTLRHALETWTPGDLARDVARERVALGLPPFGRVVRVEGSEDLLAKAMGLVLEGTRLEAHAEIAVVPSPTGSRTLLCDRRIAQEVVNSLRGLQREWSVAGQGEIRLKVDGPLDPSA
jgi:primosomal protein N' (replication factor Y)